MAVSTRVIRKHGLLLFLAIGCALQCSAGRADDKTVFDVRKYGALGDGKTLDTVAVQAAIDAAHAAGGGRVVLSPGQYVCGTVFLKSRVTLRLEKGATILGSPDAKDYQAIGSFIDGVGAQRGFALLGAIDAMDIALEGQGKIDGQGKNLARTRERPFLLRFAECKNLSISGLALDNAASWNCNLMDCDGVSIKDISINSTGGGNNDGIDVDSCRDVQITGCDITSGDDSICLKSTLPKPCRDVTVSGCKIASGWGAFKFGTESMGPFENVKISDCTITKARGGV
jgi:polygalacturonase